MTGLSERNRALVERLALTEGAEIGENYVDMQPVDLDRLMDAARAEGEIQDDWTPTAANINGLPEPLRRYIHDLETNADPAGMVLENHQLRQQAVAVTAMFNAEKRDADRYRWIRARNAEVDAWVDGQIIHDAVLAAFWGDPR
jgi:hypothetical protein